MTRCGVTALCMYLHSSCLSWLQKWFDDLAYSGSETAPQAKLD